MSEPTPTDPDDLPDPDERPSPGASDPGEPGYDGRVTVGDDSVEGLTDPDGDADEGRD
jgi:hypothetical protein